MQPGEPPIFSDTRLHAFKAAGLRHGVWRTVGPGALKHAWGAKKAGFSQTKTMGDPWQQGGILVIDPSGALKYAYASEEAGDHPPVQDVLNSLDR